jgi:hypothetical protein
MVAKGVELAKAETVLANSTLGFRDDMLSAVSFSGLVAIGSSLVSFAFVFRHNLWRSPVMKGSDLYRVSDRDSARDGLFGFGQGGCFGCGPRPRDGKRLILRRK